MAAGLILAPVAHAQTTTQIGDPYTDTLQVWSEIAEALTDVAHDIASLFGPLQLATSNAPNTEAASAALAAYTQSRATPSEIESQPATSTENITDTAISDQTTLSQNVNSPQQNTTENPDLATEARKDALIPASPAFNANFVTQNELADALSALTAKFSTQETASVPQWVAAGGNPNVPYAAENNIGNLSGVTITNANLTASEIPALNYFPATSTVAVGYGGTGTSNPPTYGQLLVGNGSGGYSLTATSSLGVAPSFTASYPILYNGNNLSLAFGTTTANTWSQLQTLSSGLISQASSTFSSTLNANTLNLANALGVASGGTGWASLATGYIPFGNGSSALATSSNLFFDAAHGRLGIGTTSPDQLLAVNGTVDITNGNSYDIGNTPILQSSSTAGELFVGANAGNASATGTQDIAIGQGAGSAITGNQANGNPQQDLFIGYNAGHSATTPRETTCVGDEACFSMTGSGVGVEDSVITAFGTSAGYNLNGVGATGGAEDAVLLGQKAGFSATSTYNLVAVGAHAAYCDGTGYYNTFVGGHSIEGFNVGGTCTSWLNGTDNVGFGYEDGAYLTGAAQENSFGGDYSGYGGSAGNTGSNNSGWGYDTLNTLTTGNSNSALGSYACEGLTTASGVVCLGDGAGVDLANSTGPIMIGYNAGGPNGAGSLTQVSGDIVIGYNAGNNIPNVTSGGIFVVGSDNLARNTSYAASNVFFGCGYNTTLSSQAGCNTTINGTGGNGTNQTGYNLTIAGGKGTGSGAGGSVIFQTAPAGSNGSGANNLSADMTITSPGNIAIGTSTPYSRLTIWGPDTASTSAFAVVNSASTTLFAVFDNGNSTYSGSIFQSSDQRLKTDVQSLDASSSLAAIEQLNPVSYLRIDQPGTNENLGFIAQAVQQIFPELVSTTSATALTPGGTLTLNYEGLIAPIVSAIQALDSELSSVEQTIAGFAQNFVSNDITANNSLCVKNSAGTPVCVTGDELAALLSQSAGADFANPTPDIDSSSSQNLADTTPGSAGSGATDTPPVLQVNGDNPAVVQIGETYNDLGATITGPQADLNLGIQTFVNGVLMSPVQIDTSATATDTVQYVVTDQTGLTSTTTRTVIVEAPSIVSTGDASTTAASSTGQ